MKPIIRSIKCSKGDTFLHCTGNHTYVTQISDRDEWLLDSLCDSDYYESTYVVDANVMTNIEVIGGAQSCTK